MTLREEIVAVLEKTKAEIQANMQAKNINASGRTSAAFAVLKREASIDLVLQAGQHAPLSTLEIGRPAGNVPGGFSANLAKTGAYAGKPDVSNVFKYMLIKWAEQKGFVMNWGGATNLGRKIAYEGTERHKNPVNVYSAPVHLAVERLREITNRSVLARVGEIVKTNF